MQATYNTRQRWVLREQKSLESTSNDWRLFLVRKYSPETDGCFSLVYLLSVGRENVMRDEINTAK